MTNFKPVTNDEYKDYLVQNEDAREVGMMYAKLFVFGGAAASAGGYMAAKSKTCIGKLLGIALVGCGSIVCGAGGYGIGRQHEEVCAARTEETEPEEEPEVEPAEDGNETDE